MPVVNPYAFRKIKPQHSAAWGARSKVVDDLGHLLPVFRGEHGNVELWGESKLGSLSFGTATTASLYAMEPNDNRMHVRAPKVFPVFLDISNPFVNDGGDPFLDLSRYAEVFGIAEACRIALKFAKYIEHTNAWEDEFQPEYDTIERLVEQRPDQLLELYFNVYALLDDPDEVARLQAAGFDGAIYGGCGASALETEYRIFSAEQVRSVWDTALAA